MAKTATIATASPLVYATGRDVLVEEAQLVGEMANWAACQRPVVHLSYATGPDAWDTSNAVRTIDLSLGASSGWTTRIRTRIYIAPETVAVLAGARCYCPASNECQVRITIGGAAAATLTTFTSSTNSTEHTTSIATSSTGTGWQEVTIETNHSTGSSTALYVRSLRIEDAIITVTALPDPSDS